MKLNVNIEQTLHGYDDGHRLLASSSTLSSDEENTLLELSDLSGFQVKGFEEYLTGFPIPNSDKYAFAKTWYAPEMKRPGCVWTHTLLINQKEFNNIFDLNYLLKIFRRPEKGYYSFYEDKTSYSFVSSSESSLTSPVIDGESHQNNIALYTTFYRHLYNKSQILVLGADNSLKYEKFVVSFWSQQWSELRFEFSFCTGSLSDRKINDQSFTLQISPRQNISSFLSSRDLENNELSSKKAIIEKPSLQYTEEYVKSLYQKMYDSFKFPLNINPENSSFQSDNQILRFVWYYGKKISPFRKNFAWLAKFYTLIERPEKDSELLNEITKALLNKFPKEDDVSDLKSILYGGKIFQDESDMLFCSPPVLSPLTSERKLLSHLLDLESTDGLSLLDLNLVSRFIDLWNKETDFAEKLLKKYIFYDQINKLQKEFIKTSADFISITVFAEIWKSNNELANLLLERNPWLAIIPEVWTQSKSSQEKLFELLLHSYLKKKGDSKWKSNWKKLVYILLDTKNDYFTQKLEDLFAQDLINWILDWHSTNLSKAIPSKWLELIRKNPEYVMKWLVNNDKKVITSGLIAQHLNPLTEIVKNYGSKPWINLAKSDNKTFTESEIIKINSFLLVLGLSNIDELSPELVPYSFPIIYKAASQEKLPSEVWEQIAPIAPSSWFSLGWDKCSRLEDSLINLVMHKNWSIEIIIKTAKSKKLFSQFVYKLSRSYQGRNLLKELNKKAEEGKVIISSKQTEVMEKDFW